MNWILGLLAKWTIGQKALGAVSWANERLSGKRTEIIAGLQCLLYVLKKLGLLPPEAAAAADSLAVALLGALPLTLADKIKRGQEIANKVVPDKKA